MTLVIRKPGILTTVQDIGRIGHRSLGINPNGVMDTAAAQIVNTLLGNDENEAVLEMHFPAPEILAEKDCSLAIGGSDFAAELNGVPVRNWSSFLARKGDILRFTKPSTGTRTYLTAAGGFDIEEWLGSRSTNLVAEIGGFQGRKLEVGDRLELRKPALVSPHAVGPSIIPKYSRFPTVRVIPSGEFQLLTALSERLFVNEGFTVMKDSNRMGYRLAGPKLHLLHKKEMVSAAVAFGTIQLLPDGQLIVLMADHQTSGGYPRIANVISADLPLLAQLGPNDGVSFHGVTVKEATRAAEHFERELCRLRTGIRLSG